jgi:hypothetical protein
MHVHVKVDIVGISGGCGLLVCIQRDPWYYINTPILHGHAGLVVPYSIVEYTPSAILAPFVLLRSFNAVTSFNLTSLLQARTQERNLSLVRVRIKKHRLIQSRRLKTLCRLL